MALHTEVWTGDFTQLEAGLKNLQRLQQEIYATSPPPANIPNLSSNLGVPTDPGSSLNALARFEGSRNAIANQIRDVQKAAGAPITGKQYEALRGDQSIPNPGGFPYKSAAALAAGPQSAGLRAGLTAQGVPEAEQEALIQQAIVAKQAAARSAKAAAKAGEDIAINEAGLATITNQETALANQAVAAAETSAKIDKQLIAAKEAQAQALRESIVKIQSQLNPGNASADAAALQGLSNEELLAMKAEQKAALRKFNAEQSASLERQRVEAKLANPAALRAEAVAEAQDAVKARELSVQKGVVKETALYDQIKANETFRINYATEAALQKARIGIEQQAVAEALGKVRTDSSGGTYKLRDDVVAGSAATKAENTIQAADEAKILAANHEYIAAKVRAAKSYDVEKLAILEQTAESQLVARGQRIAQEKLAQETITIAEIEALMSEDAIKVKAQRIAAEKLYAIKLEEQVAIESAARGIPVTPAGGSGGRGGGISGEGGAAGFFGGGLASTLRYALPSLLLFGAASGLAKSIKEAEELQKQFELLKAQAVSLGQTADLGTLETQILDIAASSGTAATEVASLAFQFQGAFGGDTAKTIRETEAAVEAVKVTGLSLKETTDAFTALTQSFKDTDVSIADITDTSLGLQERFGVLAKETISFAADLAPVGSQIGFTAQKLETLGAVANKYSGQSGSNLAGAFSRILPQLQKNAIEVIALFDRAGQKQASVALAGQFGRGDTGGAFETILANYKKLSAAQQNYIIEQVGGRREAAALIGVLEHGDEYFNSLAKGQDDAGKSSKYFAEIQKSLAQNIAVLGEQLKQLGIKLFQGGLGQALTLLGGVAQGVVSSLGGILSIITALNQATDGWIGNLIGVVVAFKALQGIVAIAQAGITKMTGATVVNKIATDADTESIAANSVASGINTETRVAAGGGLGRFFGITKANPALAAEAAAVPPAASFSAFSAAAAAEKEAEVAASGRFASSKLGVLGRGAEKAASGLSGFAAGIPPILIWAGLALAIGKLVEVVNEFRDNAEKQRVDFTSFENQNKTYAQRIADADKFRSEGSQVTGAVGFVGNLTGYNYGQTADKLESETKAPSYIEAAKALVEKLKAYSDQDFTKSGLTAGTITQLEDAIKALKENPDNIEKIKLIDDVLNHIREFDPALADFLKGVIDKKIKEGDAALAAKKERDKSNPQDAASADLINNIATKAGEIKSQIDSGELSAGSGLAQTKQAISYYESVINGAQGPEALKNIGGADGAAAKYAELKKLQNDIISKAAYNDAQGQLKLTQLQTDDPQANVNYLASLLESGKLNPDDQKKATADLYKSLKELYDFRLKTAVGLDAQLAIINNGVPIPTTARVSSVTEQIRTGLPDYQEFLSEQDAGVKKFLDDNAGELSKIIVIEGKTLNEAIALMLRHKADLEDQQAEELGRNAVGDPAAYAGIVKKQKELTDQAAADRAAADKASNAALGTPIDPASYTEDAATKKAERKKAQDDAISLLQARYAYYKELASGDSIAQINYDIQGATAELAVAEPNTKEWYAAAGRLHAAQEALKAAIKKRRDGWYALMRALNEGNSLAIDQIDLQQALEELGQAKPDDVDAAKAKVVNVQNKIRQDNARRIESTYSYYKAVASDNPVEAADLEVQAALAALASSTVDELDAANARVVTAQKAARDARNAVNDAYNQYVLQVYSDDPIRAAQERVRIAKEELAKAEVGSAAYYDALKELDAANKAQRDADQSLAEAQANLSAARVAGDPVKSARVAYNKAIADYQNAKSEADRLNAVAALIAADRSMQDALSAIFDAQAKLLEAQAGYVGDTIRVAQIGLDEAKRKLAEVQHKFDSGSAGQADVTSAKADVINAQNALRQAQLSKFEDDYAFQYEMGQITKSQYIAYLEGLKALADGNVTIIRDLDRKIHQLKQDLGKDLQFNLPTNIGLPTLYEARRLSQSVNPAGQPAGYQDQRNIQVNITVNSGMDVQQVKTVLGDALGNQRFGTALRKY